MSGLISDTDFPAKRPLEIKDALPDGVYEALEDLERYLLGRRTYPSACWEACQKLATEETDPTFQSDQYYLGRPLEQRFLRRYADILKRLILETAKSPSTRSL